MAHAYVLALVLLLMPTVPWDGFIGGTYLDRHPAVSFEDCINRYPEITGAPGTRARSPIVLKRTPGLDAFATAGNGPIRALFYQDGRCFAVSGSEFYEIDAAGTATLRSTSAIASNINNAQIASNGTAGNQLLVISGGSGYIYNLTTNTLTLISDADFPSNAVMGGFIDGYFVVLAYNTRQFNFSALNDGTTWAALDVQEKSQTSDNVRALVIDRRLIYLLGSKATEPWYNTGDANATFAPVQEVIEHGIGSPWSAVPINNTIAWIGEDEHGAGQAWTLQGYTPVRFSTNAVESQWRAYGSLRDAYAHGYQEEGHTFYQVTFPGKGTWVYDFATQMWHRRARLVRGTFEPHLARGHAFAFDKHLVGSRVDGTIYHQSLDYLDDDGQPIRWVRRAPHLLASGRLSVNAFRLLCQTGIGLTSGQGSDPQVMLRTSIDGGRTWSDELWESAGVIGDYRRKVEWNRLGQAEGGEWGFEFAGTDPVDDVLVGAELEVS